MVGSEGEVDQYKTMAETYAPLSRKVTVKVESWPNDSAMLGAFRDGEKVPDVFIANRRHLYYLVQHQLVQPVDQLLDDRGFDFGDEFPRSSLTAFGSDNRLECLPYGVQPSVVYYNKKLVRLARIKNPPIAGTGLVARPVRRGRPVGHPAPPGCRRHLARPVADRPRSLRLLRRGRSLRQCHPADVAGPLQRHQPRLAHPDRARPARTGHDPDPAQLERHTPLEWFMRGKLALLEGNRRMVPDLRSTPGLNFDVMPMPSLGTSATVGNLTGLCLSQHAHGRRDRGGLPGLRQLAREPWRWSRSAATSSPPTRRSHSPTPSSSRSCMPRHASVFTFSVKSMVYPPEVADWDELELAVDPLIDEAARGRPVAGGAPDQAHRPRVVPQSSGRHSDPARAPVSRAG